MNKLFEMPDSNEQIGMRSSLYSNLEDNTFVSVKSPSRISDLEDDSTMSMAAQRNEINKSPEREAPVLRRAKLKEVAREREKSIESTQSYQQLVDFSSYQAKQSLSSPSYTTRLRLTGSVASAGVIELGDSFEMREAARDKKLRLQMEEEQRKQKATTMKKEPRTILPMNIKLKPYQIEELKEAFRLLENGSDFIQVKDVTTVIRACGFEPDREEVKEIIQEIKPANDGLITIQELMQIFEVKLTRQDQIEEIRRAFKVFDINDKGMITLDDLKHISKCIGEDLHEEEMKEMINAADRTRSGGVTLENFVKLIHRKEYFDD